MQKTISTLQDKVLVVTQYGKEFHILKQTIVYIRKRKKYTIIQTNEKEISCHESLKAIHLKLENDKYLKIGNYIFNLEKIMMVNKEEILFSYDWMIPIPAYACKKLKKWQKTNRR